MSSLEFFTLVKEHLKENGVMVVNMNMRGQREGNINQYLADTIARTAFAPQEMPIGVMTAFIGAPVFILMIRRIYHEDRG